MSDQTKVTAEQVSAAFAVIEKHLIALEFMNEGQLRQIVREMLEAANAK